MSSAGSVEAPPEPGGRWFGDPVGLLVTIAWMFALGLGPVYSLRNRIEPMPSGQYIDDALVNGAFVGLHVVVIIVLALAAVRTRRLPAISRLTGGVLAALHLLVIASAWWSLAPGRSGVQGTLFALTTVAAVVVGDRVGVRGVVLSLAVASQAGVVLSQLAVRRTWPNTIDPNGDWAGVYLNRNSLGPVAVVALLATLGAAALWLADRTRERRRKPEGANGGVGVEVVGGLIAGVVVVGLLALDAHTLLRSASLTPMVGAAVALVTVLVAAVLPGWLRRLRPEGASVGPGALGAGVLVVWVALAAVAALGRSQLAPGLDRSTTLSGRTELWGWLIDAISRRPFSGWGWLGVWEDKALEADVVARFEVDFSTAHNAVLEMLLAAGLVGAVLLVVAVGAVVWPVLGLAARPGAERTLGVVAMGFVGYVVAVNQLETYVGANLLPWALLIALGAACARWLSDEPGEPSGLDAQRTVMAS